jgi:CBS domain-containing protein
MRQLPVRVTPDDRPLGKVRDVMSGQVVVIDAGATLRDALERLVAARLRHLAVVEGADFARCVGVLADRHLAAFWPLEPAALSRRTVVEVLPTPQPFVRPDDSLEHTASLMLAHGLDAVPVLDVDDQLIGIVTVSDMLTAVATHAQTD